MRTVFLFAATLLTGCVSTYTPKIVGDSAQLVVRVDQSSLGTGAVVQAQTYADATCRANASGTEIATFSRIGPNTSANSSTHRIPAGAPFIFTFYRFAGAMGIGDCKGTYSFIPSPGASYTASFSGTCSVSIRNTDGSPIEGLQRVDPPCYRW